MADTKISGLAAGAPAQAGDLIPIARSGANYSITPANILAYGTSPVAGTSGTFSTTLGVTGASTLAALSATTIGASGTITSTKTSGAFLTAPSGGANLLYVNIGNTSGTAIIGVDSSAGGTWTGSAAYSTLVGTDQNKSVHIGVNGAVVSTHTTAGLAVTGTLSATTGAAVGGATAGAGGLAFPATAVAVADANTLDDYEEGTWTPVLRGSSTAGTQTYSAQIGRYTKIGRVVCIEMNITLSAKDVATAGNMQISGLPFTINGTVDTGITAGLCAGWDLNVAGGYYSIAAIAAAAGTLINLYEQGDNVAVAALTAADVSNTSGILTSFHYTI